MKRLSIVVALTLGATFAVTALSSSAVAGSARAVAKSKPAVWINGSGKQAQLPAPASKHVRALVKNARTLQASTSGVFLCPGASSTTNTPGEQRCSFTGTSGVCIQQSTNPDVVQVCKFAQGPVAGKNNLAIASQVILQRNSGPSGDQRGHQIVKIQQQNTTKSNLAFVTQIVKQSLGIGANDPDDEAARQAVSEAKGAQLGGLPDFGPVVSQVQNVEPATEGDETSASTAPVEPVSQVQNSQQTVRICQGGETSCLRPGSMTGSNLSSVYQSLRQRDRAKNGAPILQQQNPDLGSCDDPDTGPFASRNMCAFVDQSTNNPGKNASGVVELYRQFQSAANTAGNVTQQQDPAPDVHGLDHDIHQLSAGPDGSKRNTIATVQVGRQVQRVKNVTGTIVQFQDPRAAKGAGSSQTGTSADTWFGRQFGTEIQTINGVFTTGVDTQEQLLTYDGETTGTFDVLQRGVQNDRTATSTCPDPAFPGSDKSCHLTVECASATTIPDDYKYYEGEPTTEPAFCRATNEPKGGERWRRRN